MKKIKECKYCKCEFEQKYRNDNTFCSVTCSLKQRWKEKKATNKTNSLVDNFKGIY